MKELRVKNSKQDLNMKREIKNLLCSSVVTITLVTGPTPTEVEAESVML